MSRQVIGVTGPFRDASKTKYWSVRVLEGTVLIDHRYYSETSARNYAAEINSDDQAAKSTQGNRVPLF